MSDVATPACHCRLNGQYSPYDRIVTAIAYALPKAIA
jgi:hypothetical protein